MKLLEALEIAGKQAAEGSPLFRVRLVCGFMPTHFQTFLQAYLRLALPGRQVEVVPALYGDFWGNLQGLELGDYDAGVVVMEWADADPRLGLRNLAKWAPAGLEDISKTVRERCLRFQEMIQRLSRNAPLAICFPTLPLPPLSYTPTWQASSLELELRSLVSKLSFQLAESADVTLVNSQRLDELSPPGVRFDVRSELQSGFPYKLPHTSVLAEMLSRLVQPPAIRKGLITDLDDTLWRGILGEVGVENVSWDLERHSHMHAVYQKLLHALSEGGVLVGIVSRNDPALVEKALTRDDLLIPRDAIFPIEAGWGPKSASVDRILKIWNIGADAVVFIDDSPMELAEVKAAYPDVECILFPKEDPEAIQALFYRLRELFGKRTLLEEDALRLQSIQRAHAHGPRPENGQRDVSPHFLLQLEAELAIKFAKQPLDPRALELVNKTNQFNLNGRRYTDKAWQEYMARPDTFLLIASYRDKFGPLGKIAVLAGRTENTTLFVELWVMSCRAFGRHIEHRCLAELFARFPVEEVILDLQPTPRNGPMREFLAGFLNDAPAAECRLTRQQFQSRSAESYHRVLEVTNG